MPARESDTENKSSEKQSKVRHKEGKRTWTHQEKAMGPCSLSALAGLDEFHSLIIVIISFAIRQLIPDESNQTFIRHDDTVLLPETNAP